MILPNKHLQISESIIGLGAVVLKILEHPKTVDEIWQNYIKKYNESQDFPAYHNFDNMLLAINLLFMIGAVDTNQNGELYYANIRT